MSVLPTQPSLPNRQSWVLLVNTVVSFLGSSPSPPDCEIERPLLAAKAAAGGKAKRATLPPPWGTRLVSGQRPGAALTAGNFREAQGCEGTLLRKI